MKIENNKVVTFHYSLNSIDGEVFETSSHGEPMAYLHGHGNIMPALEAELAGKEEGEQLKVTLSPEQAYGERRENSQQRIPIKHLVGVNKKKLRKGMAVKVNTDQGTRDVTIVKVGKFNVDVDSNHPLAGLTLTFDINIQTVRDATDEEIAHKHAHGPGGHHH